MGGKNEVVWPVFEGLGARIGMGWGEDFLWRYIALPHRTLEHYQETIHLLIILHNLIYTKHNSLTPADAGNHETKSSDNVPVLSELTEH
jgi:hypothetical protein